MSLELSRSSSQVWMAAMKEWVMGSNRSRLFWGVELGSFRMS